MLSSNFVKKNNFFSENKRFVSHLSTLPLLKSSAFHVFTYQSKMFYRYVFCKAKCKEARIKDQLLWFLQSKKTLILPSKIYSRQSIIISSFYKDEKRLENKIFFLDQKTFKLFTFLPFETPNILFLPKMGSVLFYSSSFSMINYV